MKIKIIIFVIVLLVKMLLKIKKIIILERHVITIFKKVAYQTSKTLMIQVFFLFLLKFFFQGNNNVYGKKNQNKNATYQTTYPIFQQTIPISIASVGIPSHPPPFSVFNGASMVVPNYNNVSNPQNVNFSNIAPPLSLTSVSNKWNNIGTSGQTFISSNTSKAQSSIHFLHNKKHFFNFF